jgi:hypothetical protein
MTVLAEQNIKVHETEPNVVVSESNTNSIKRNQTTKFYRPRLSAGDVNVLMDILRDKLQMEKNWRAECKRECKDKLYIEVSEFRSESYLRILRKMERCDPDNYGYRYRWGRHKVEHSKKNVQIYRSEIIKTVLTA